MVASDGVHVLLRTSCAGSAGEQLVLSYGVLFPSGVRRGREAAGVWARTWVLGDVCVCVCVRVCVGLI